MAAKRLCQAFNLGGGGISQRPEVNTSGWVGPSTPYSAKGGSGVLVGRQTTTHPDDAVLACNMEKRALKPRRNLKCKLLSERRWSGKAMPVLHPILRHSGKGKTVEPVKGSGAARVEGRDEQALAEELRAVEFLCMRV